MKIADILKTYGYTRRMLSERFNIPYATVQKWCFPEDNPNHRTCPQYITAMIAEILSAESDRHFALIDYSISKQVAEAERDDLSEDEIINNRFL